MSSVSLPQDLQKQTFIESQQKMLVLPGWEMLNEHSLVALKSIKSEQFVNFVWGDPTPQNFARAQLFFEHATFSWVLKPQQNDDYLIEQNFSGPYSVAEMALQLDLQPLASSELSEKIRVVSALQPHTLQQWVEVAAQGFNFTVDEINEFIFPHIQFAGDIPYLAYYEDEPAATALLFCGEQVAGLYAISTIPKFRRQGLATAVTQACLLEAQKRHLKYATLSSSAMGQTLYKKLGFQVVQFLREYSSPQQNFYSG